GDGEGGRVAAPRVLEEAGEADRLEVARELWLEPRRRHRVGRLDQPEGGQGGRPGQGRPAGEHFIQEGPERVDVARRGGGAGLMDHLRGEVRGRPDDHAREGQRLVLGDGPGETEVRYLRFKIPNPKSEIRNKSQIRISKI